MTLRTIPHPLRGSPLYTRGPAIFASLVQREVAKRSEAGGIDMDYKHNPALVPFAKKLRKEMTKEERHLWYDFLRTYPVKFLRQKVIGDYIADFYCAKAKLVIELDGSQHYEPNAEEKDKKRTDYLKQYGITVLRIPNNQINQSFDAVCEYLDRIIASLVQREVAERSEAGGIDS